MVRICFFGVGGVGGWLGARVAKAKAAEVMLIARGAHGAAIREHGLRLRVRSRGEAGEVQQLVELPPEAAEVYPNAAAALESGARKVDFVVLGVKAWQVREAATEAAQLLAPAGCIVTTQNGVEAPQAAREVVGPERVLGGICQVLAFIAEPGVVEMQVNPSVFYFGEAYDAEGVESKVARSERAEQLLRVFESCQGFTGIGITENGVWTALWEKAIIMCCIGPIGALCRAPLVQLFDAPETRAMTRAAMLEVAACGAAAGHLTNPEAIVDANIKRMDTNLQPGVTSSTTRDVVMGKPSELHQLSGAICRTGRALGVPTPVHDIIFAALLPQERRARGEDSYQLMGVPGGAPHVSLG